MRIYLVRHGQCDSNLLGRYNFIDEDINENGIKQAEELQDKIRKLDYDIVISSPLVRALHTAEIINVNNKEIITDNRLEERKHGSLEGKPTSVTDREDYWNYYSKTKYGTEESVVDICNRVKEFLDDLKSKDYKSVLIVAHSGISKGFYVYFNGVPEDGRLLDKGLKNIEIIEYIL